MKMESEKEEKSIGLKEIVKMNDEGKKKNKELRDNIKKNNNNLESKRTDDNIPSNSTSSVSLIKPSPSSLSESKSSFIKPSPSSLLVPSNQKPVSSTQKLAPIKLNALSCAEKKQPSSSIPSSACKLKPISPAPAPKVKLDIPIPFSEDVRKYVIKHTDKSVDMFIPFHDPSKEEWGRKLKQHLDKVQTKKEEERQKNKREKSPDRNVHPNIADLIKKFDVKIKKKRQQQQLGNAYRPIIAGLKEYEGKTLGEIKVITRRDKSQEFVACRCGYKRRFRERYICLDGTY
jgi:hypothetical protein